MTTLIPILGDQLSLNLAALAQADRADSVVLMMEVAEETLYVRHHKAKLVFILSAMRHHGEALRAAGWRIDYVRLDDPDNTGSFTGEVARAAARHGADRILVTEAGEWRVQAMLEAWQTLLGVPVNILPDDRFICGHAEFAAWAARRTTLTMEWFYREMRTKTGLLMEGRKPAGGRWNFDRDNRKRASRTLLMPQPLAFPPDAITREVMALVEVRFPINPGSFDTFDWAVTREDALRQQAYFLDHTLRDFGDYQDAMLSGERHLWHSLLSPYLNAGLLDPLALCREVDARWRAEAVPLNAAEGYIRQIIGWREYVRGIYWREGPDYARRNFFNNTRPLPAFYWTGETDMHCMAEALDQTLATAHAHHIQRLMVEGNFALLIGADPHQVHRWYLEIYLDAYEWVELPNTLAMSQYADGGQLGTKPYAASGKYIDRMSDYCRSCRFDPNERLGETACPFNALYWDFLARNRDKLGDNHRLRGPYVTWDRFSDDSRSAIRAKAADTLARLDATPGYD